MGWALVNGVQTCALPILVKPEGGIRHIGSDPRGLGGAGCAGGVFRAGKPVRVTAAGAADIADARALDGDTLFYAASVSKQFTALAAAKLVEAGKIVLAADIRTYFPDMPPPTRTEHRRVGQECLITCKYR